MLNEIGIVPVPGSCNRYYVTYLMQEACGMSPFIGVGLHYAVVEVNLTTYAVSIISNANLIGEFHDGFEGGLAISKIKPGNIRYLYATSGNAIKVYKITSSGITYQSTGYSSLSHETNEVEISPDGTKIAWGSLIGNIVNIYTATLKPDGDFDTFQTYLIPTTGSYGLSSIGGVEFNEDGTRLYGSLSKFIRVGGMGKNVGGIFYLDLTTGTTTMLNTDGQYSGTNIELSKDGNMYLADNSNNLVSLNLATHTFSTFSPTTTILGHDKYYNTILPDQVDGENYSHNYGVPKSHGSWRINHVALSPTVPKTFYTCQSWDFITDITNNAQCQIQVQKALNDGNIDYVNPVNFYWPVSGSASSWSTTGWPSNFDLRSLNSNYFHNTANANKYYMVTVRVKNSCGVLLEQKSLIHVGTLTSTSSAFKINQGGPFVAPSTDIFNPTQTGYSPSINGSYSTGDIQRFTFLLEKYNCSNGARIGSAVCWAEFGQDELTLLNNSMTLNYILSEKCGQNGYFTSSMNWDQCYKITFGVHNICGSDYESGYIKNSNPNWRIGFGDALTDPETLQKSAVVPNPFSGSAMLKFSVYDTAPVTVKVMDVSGNVILIPVDGKVYTPGNYEVEIDGATLKKGIYFYTILSDQLIESGKFIKAE